MLVGLVRSLSARFVLVSLSVLLASAPVGTGLAAEAPAKPASGDACPEGSAARARKIELESQYGSFSNAEKLTLEQSIQKAYLNIQLAQADLEIVAREECLSKQKTEPAIAKAVEAYEMNPLDAEAARAAVETTAELDFITAKLDLAKSAQKATRDQFIKLKAKADEARLAKDPDQQVALKQQAAKLAVLIPTYPTAVRIAQIEKEKPDIYKAASLSQATASKAGTVAKEAKRFADDAKALVLANSFEAAGEPAGSSSAERVEAARRALAAAENAADAERMAKDAQTAGDVVGGLTLRAQSRPSNLLEAQDLATARALLVQMKSDGDRIQYARTEALLNKLNISATVEQKLSVAKEREGYVELMTVLANNPDAQALIGSPGVKLTAQSGESAATLKLSLDKLFGDSQRTFDLTLSAPTTKNRTSLANSVDGLSGGISAQLTATKYSLLEFQKEKYYFGLLGIGGKIGHETHTYVDEADLSGTKDTTKTPSSALVYAGLAPVSMKWLLLGKFEYQKAYKDGDPATECPVQATGPVKCVSGSLGAPAGSHKRIWSLELRKAWDSIAVGALLSRDTVARKTRADVPLYFLTAPNKDGVMPSLTGGINFSWDSVKHGSVGLFIGSAFEVKDF